MREERERRERGETEQQVWEIAEDEEKIFGIGKWGYVNER
jgi:hypothetical protein